MLFAKQQYDISDLVIRTILRAEKREELTKKQLKAQEAKEAQEDFLDENPELAERQKLLDEKNRITSYNVCYTKLLRNLYS